MSARTSRFPTITEIFAGDRGRPDRHLVVSFEGQPGSPSAHDIIDIDVGLRPSIIVVGLEEPQISVSLYTSKTYLLSATQTLTQGRMFETRPRYEPLEIKSRPIFQLKIAVFQGQRPRW